MTVLKRSSDLLNNVKKYFKVNLGLLLKHILFTIYGVGDRFGQVTLNNLMNTSLEI